MGEKIDFLKGILTLGAYTLAINKTEKMIPWDDQYESTLDYYRDNPLWIPPVTNNSFEWKCEYCGRKNTREDKCDGCYAPYKKQ